MICRVASQGSLLRFAEHRSKTESCTTEVTVHRHRPFVNCPEGSDLPEETLLGTVGKSVHHGSSDILHKSIRTQNIRECVGPRTSARLALCPQRSSYRLGRHSTCQCISRNQQKVCKGPWCCLLREYPWSAWADMGALTCKETTWAPEVALHAHRCVLSYARCNEIYY